MSTHTFYSHSYKKIVFIVGYYFLFSIQYIHVVLYYSALNVSVIDVWRGSHSENTIMGGGVPGYEC